ncbi:MAG: hypothetical protein ACOH2A_06105 [Sphingobacteriaceae bacterium]
MSKNNLSHPSAGETPSNQPVDPGKKSKIKEEDKVYRQDNEDFGDVAQQKENSEQPVHPVKKASKEK